MSGNTVRINGSDNFLWYVGDAKMIKLIEYLDKIGHSMVVKNGSYVVQGQEDVDVKANSKDNNV